ncbi:MAG TPA: GWxTD domain-containing protein [Gemmatimonadales bacterium]|nr:GWxTD domain-containing protein [Gemmatimonadales bacterium]
MKKTVLFSLALMAAPVMSARPQSLELAAVRFYRTTGAQTLVDAFCQVPFGLLDPLTQGTGGIAAYRFAVTVHDAAGTELLSQSWLQTVPVRMLAVSRGSAVEHFSFAARPGKYTIDVTVTDSATGRVSRQSSDVNAYAAAPAGSDLLLATGLRSAEGDTTPAAGEIRKGAVLLQASGRPVLTPQQARLGYYLELYAPRAETVTVVVRVATPQGRQIIATAGERIPIAAGGGVTRAMLDLAGLPPGDYRLEVAAGGTDSIVRTAMFRMAGFETEAAIADATPAEDVFAGQPEGRLDTLYLPLVYLMTADEQGSYPSLTLDGKRRWLRQFWAKRDPTAGTPRNEAREDFYARIAEANRRFREGGSAQIPGWRTDRGRVFIKYGPPDEVLDRPQAGNTRPYVVWKFTRGRALKYVFLDPTGFGNYVLIWTSDRREPSRPNWEEMLGPEAVIEVERF